MPLFPLPDILHGLDFKNPETGEWGIPDSATDEQKAAYADFQKNVKEALKNRCRIIPPTADEVKESLSLTMEGKTKEERKVKLESYRLTLEPILGDELDEVFALYL
jgi:hypothetical protein